MSDDRVALAGALRLVDLRHVLDAFLEQAHAGLRDLTEAQPARSDADRWPRMQSLRHATAIISCDDHSSSYERGAPLPQ